MAKKNIFRVIIRGGRWGDTLSHYAFFPDQAATPGRVAYMQFDVKNGKIIPDHFDEMPISACYDLTEKLSNVYIEHCYSPTCGIFDIVREYLKSGADAVEGDVVLRYRLPDLSKTAWKQYHHNGKEK